MKKILFLIPLLGICSSLFAQAPQVTNVQAEQIVGTKDVQVSFELTGKPGASLCFIEVWFKTDSAQTQWQQVKSIPYAPEGLQEVPYDILDEGGNPIGQDKAFTTGATESPQNKMFTWNAGNDAPDISTQDARIRIIAFYPKVDELVQRNLTLNKNPVGMVWVISVDPKVPLTAMALDLLTAMVL